MALLSASKSGPAATGGQPHELYLTPDGRSSKKVHGEGLSSRRLAEEPSAHPGLPTLHILNQNPVSGTLRGRFWPQPDCAPKAHTLTAEVRRRIALSHFSESHRLSLMDYEIQRFTRHCAVTGRELAPGEEFYTALVAAGAELKRIDYSAEAWQGPPEGALA